MKIVKRTTFSLTEEDLKIFNMYKEVFSRRYSVKKITDAETFRRLLHEINNIKNASKPKIVNIHNLNLQLSFWKRLKFLFTNRHAAVAENIVLEGHKHQQFTLKY